MTQAINLTQRHEGTNRAAYGALPRLRGRGGRHPGGEPLLTVLSQKPAFETLRLPVESVR